MGMLERVKASGFTGRHGHPCLYDVISEAISLSKPLSYLEIGVFDGASLCSVLELCKPERIVLCDIFASDWQHWLLDSPRPNPGTHGHIDSILARYGVSARFLVEDSKTAIPKLRETFDLIHIDGNHDTEYARADFRNCLPLLNPRGYLVMDDTSFTEVKPVLEEINSCMEHVLTLSDSESASSLFRAFA